jgi:ankyrin repeat protein
MPLPLTALPVGRSLAEYDTQAQTLLEAWRSGDPAAIQFVLHQHPAFLRSDVPWLPRKAAETEVRSFPFELADARLAIARGYSFPDWERLAEWVTAVRDRQSPVSRFETAVETVINGDLTALDSALREDPSLVHARSTRVNCFDPPVHRATLLHYVAANGVEGYRQKTPPNAVEVARLILERGADPDALAHMYGGQCTTMPMLVSSEPPAKAGVQVPLLELLVDFGASVEPRGSGPWTSPLLTALAFSYLETAEALVRRGAKIDTLAAAAGLGRIADARRLLPQAHASDRHRALALAAQNGQTEIVRLLLDAGEDPDRYNPQGHHAHSTPLHQAVWAGHVDVVRLLVQRGASLDITDTIHAATPLGWAEYGGRSKIAAYLRQAAGTDRE